MIVFFDPAYNISLTTYCMSRVTITVLDAFIGANYQLMSRYMFYIITYVHELRRDTPIIYKEVSAKSKDNGALNLANC